MLTSMSRQTHARGREHFKNSSDLGVLTAWRRVGAGLAAIAYAAAAGCLVMACGGCAVTDKIMFPTDPDIPPKISDASYPTGTMIWVDTAAPDSQLQMDVVVSDQNILQPLLAQWRLVTVGDDTPPIHDGNVPASGSQVTRDFTFTVPSTLLANGKCYQLELAVSGGFLVPTPSPRAPTFFGFPKVQDDVDIARWFVLEGQPNNPSADVSMRLLASCPANPPMTPSASTTGQTMGQ
jgi:hypothetical protein